MFKRPVIVFEGIEGSGKTYHSNCLANYLKKKGYKKIQIAKIPNIDSGIAINDRIKRASIF